MFDVVSKTGRVVTVYAAKYDKEKHKTLFLMWSPVLRNWCWRPAMDYTPLEENEYEDY